MRFTKMHGLGNDYVYIDAISDPGLESLEWSSLAPGLSDRHRGVGGDGVIVIDAPRQSDCHARMRTFNADGSEAEACGNGTRCVARYLQDRLGYDDAILFIESGPRILECEPLDAGRVRVSMGSPGLELADSGVLARALESVDPLELAIDAQRLRFCAVSIGNPHAVAFAHENLWLGDDLGSQIRRLGSAIEHHNAFEQRINVHFVAVDDPRHAVVHTWERGAGPTQACGTGACAVLVAGAREGVLGHEAELALPGGPLIVSWIPPESGGDGIVRQAGPAEFVFEGSWVGSPERTLA